MSMHMTAIGAVCGFLLIIGFRYFGDVRTTFMGLLCLAGLLGTCRLYLKNTIRHRFMPDLYLV